MHAASERWVGAASIILKSRSISRRPEERLLPVSVSSTAAAAVHPCPSPFPTFLSFVVAVAGVVAVFVVISHTQPLVQTSTGTHGHIRALEAILDPDGGLALAGIPHSEKKKKKT